MKSDKGQVQVRCRHCGSLHVANKQQLERHVVSGGHKRKVAGFAEREAILARKRGLSPPSGSGGGGGGAGGRRGPAVQREVRRYVRRAASKEETIRDFVAHNLAVHLNINQMVNLYAHDTARELLGRLREFGVDLTQDVLRDRVPSAGALAQSLVAEVCIWLVVFGW